MSHKWKIPILALGILWSPLSSQTVTLTGTFNRFISYYVSSVDINTGASDVQLFDYLLECIDCPMVGSGYADSVSLDIEFRISMKSPALGIPDEETIISLRTTEPVVMGAPIPLDSRDFSAGDLDFFDVNGNPVPIRIRMEQQLEFDRFEDMFSVILQSGRLPDGIYRFRLTIDVEGGTGDVVEEVINVTTPTTLQLTSPGEFLRTWISRRSTPFILFSSGSRRCFPRPGLKIVRSVAFSSGWPNSGVRITPRRRKPLKMLRYFPWTRPWDGGWLVMRMKTGCGIRERYPGIN